MAKRMQEQKGEERSVAKSKTIAMILSSHVPTSSSSAKSPIASKNPGILIAQGKPERRIRGNSKSDAASSSQARLKDASLGGLMDTATEKLGKTKAKKDRMVTQSTRVSSHNSSYGSSILDRQGDLRTRTRWPYEWFGCEYGYLVHISEWHLPSSSSSWTRLWGEFTICEE